MSQPLLTDPRMLQLNRIKPTVPPQELGDLVSLSLRATSLQNDSPYSIDLHQLAALAMRVESRKA